MYVCSTADETRMTGFNVFIQEHSHAVENDVPLSER